MNSIATSSEASCLSPSSPKTAHATSTPRSVRSRNLSRQSLSPAKRNASLHQLSPLKSRATPQRLRAIGLSPRKSPVKSNLQQINAKSVSFTPQRTKQPPRAWERRPATPFVPRDEKQKIWKRVPLGELGVEINRPVGASRREQERTKDYTRVVKKLKVGHGDEEDKENATFSVSAKAEYEDKNGGYKRAGVNTVNFVTMRVEEDEILGSPKKKLRQPLDMETDFCVKPNDEELEEEESGSDVGDFDLEHEEHAREESCEEVDDEWQNHELAEEESNTLAVEDVAQTELETPSAELQTKTELVDDTGVESQPAPESDSDNLAEKSVALSNEQSSRPSDIITSFEEDVETGKGLNTNDVESTSASRAQQYSVESTEEQANEHQITSEEMNDYPIATEAMIEDRGSSSPPTILAENVTIDELAAKQSLTEAQITETSCVYVEDDTEETETQKVPRRISDDEAAFLRDFMSRTRAEKAAREQTSHSLTEEELECSEKAEEHEIENFHDTMQTSTSAPNLQPPIFDLAEAAPASPLRRSKRAAVTSIPRPQTIPNSIQLKRANGNEFIFTANKASSTANVAIVTRSNTKKNKGSALNVPGRLEQLMVEKANEENEAHQQTDELVKASANGANDKNGKKRKRDRNENAGKVKKVLRWNEQNLVSYQEAPKNSVDDWEDIEDSSQEASTEREMEEPARHVKLTLTLTSGSKENSPPQEQQSRGGKDNEAQESDVGMKVGNESSAAQSKVRRVRRGVVGSVNGTPAPKTRSKRFFDADEPTTELQAEEETVLEASSAASAAVRNLVSDDNASVTATAPSAAVTASRKSRMPIPLTRRGAAASATIRTAAGSSSSGPPGRTSRTVGEEKEASKSVKARGEKEAEKDDLLGRRRLRVRS